jgi:hypothetical protein
MSRKTGTDSYARKIELINRKVREINERRRGMKITAIEDDLDRQELQNYIRFLGVEPGNVRLESLGNGSALLKNRIFYATLLAEALIELLALYFIISLMLRPGASTAEWAMSGMLAIIFGYIGYRMYRDLRSR